MAPSERRTLPLAFLIMVGAGLIVLCFRNILFHDEQLAFRDAAHFYYPIYEVIQAEWGAGRIPLWNPWENGGMPMLGNPTAAVMYPGKLIYAAAPSYAWGARLYAIAHLALAVGAMYGLMRSWGVSRAGAGISGLAYGFAGPIFFQYCNIIFLVGAAWAPLGVLAADRLIRTRSRRAAAALAGVLAMQVLGGDPQAAYLVGIFSAGYAVAIWWANRPRGVDKKWLIPAWAWAISGLVLWIGATLAAGYWGPLLRPKATQTQPLPTFPWTPYWSRILLGIWGVAALAIGWRLKARPRGKDLLGRLGWLIVAGGIGGLLAAVQLVPVLEFSGLTVRASREGSHEIYSFSQDPYRLVELLWPNVFGFGFGEETGWIDALPPLQGRKVWIFSLYMGAPVLILALAAAGFRGGPPWRAWLTGMVVVGLLGALGSFTGPLWYARMLPGLDELGALGPLDESEAGPVRFDGKLRDGDGGFYWFLATFLPGFGSFRYPAKLLTFSTLGLAGLAGLGWDIVRERSCRKAQILGATAVALTAFAIGAVLLGRRPLLRFLAESPTSKGGSSFGPLVPEATWWVIVASLAHALVALVAFDLAVRLARRWPGARWPEALALLLVAADVGLAAQGQLLTVPQAMFDLGKTPRTLKLIAEAEAKDPFEGPFRIHRMPSWSPPAWMSTTSFDRGKEFVEWERDTLQPKYGLPLGVHYTETIGTAELFDTMFFFSPFMRRLRPEAAGMLGKEVGTEIACFPRRGYDLWNTRYFVVPIHGGDWKSEYRSYATFLPQTTPVYPSAIDFARMSDVERGERAGTEDFQILRNEAAYPRAWIVHKLRFAEPIRGMRKQDRINMMNEILYPADLFWTDPELNLFDPQQVAWVETDTPQTLAPYSTGGPPLPGETVEVMEENPSRVVIRAKMERPGVVVLGETYYPGWELTIDGEPAPILRINRMMRGAAVQSGEHELVYTYRPRSFLAGCVGSALGLLAAAVLIVPPRRRGGSAHLPAASPGLS